MSGQHSLAWVGLGSNLNNPAGQVRRALDELAAHPDIVLRAASSLYRTTPVGGPSDQPVFCNAAAEIATELGPYDLLSATQAIEAAHDRIRDVRWGPRTLDLDILVYDNRRCDGVELQLPHPRAHERGFVLAPLAEIAPTVELGDQGRVSDCLARVDTSDVVFWRASP